MATAAYHWHEHLASSMEGIEEGLLDETDQPTTFPTITEHHWKELVCDPSEKSSATAITAEKDWEHSITVKGGENIRIGDSMLAGLYESYVTLPVVSYVAEEDSVESQAIENEELQKPGCLIKSGFEDSSLCTISKQDFGPQPLSYSIKESIPNDEQSLHALSNPNVRPGSAPAGQNGASSRLMTGTNT